VESQPPELAKLERRLQRERQARLEAESIAERATTQLYEALRELKRESALLELLEAVAKAANQGPTVADAMQVGLSRICAHTGWPVGHALVLSDDRPPQLVSSGGLASRRSLSIRRVHCRLGVQPVSPGRGAAGQGSRHRGAGDHRATFAGRQLPSKRGGAGSGSAGRLRLPCDGGT